MTRLWGTRALVTLLSGALTAGALAAVVVAAPAHADSSLAFSPTSHQVTTLPIAARSSNVAAAGSYGFSVTGFDPSKPLKVVATGATAGSLLIQRTGTGSTPTAAGPWIAPPLVMNPLGSPGTVISSAPSNTDVYWLATSASDHYTLTFYQEASTGDQTIYGDEDTFGSVRMDLISYDPANTVPGSLDNRSVFFFADGPINVGDRLPFKVGLPLLTTTDIRGTGADGLGALGTALRGTDGTNGAIRVQVKLGSQPAQTAPLTFTGVETTNPNVVNSDFDVYTGTYGPVQAGGRITSSLTVGPTYQTTRTTDVGRDVTLSVPPRAEGGAKVTLTGTADPRAKVLISVTHMIAPIPSGFTPLATVTASSSGAWSLTTTATQTSQFQASENGKTPDDTSASTMVVNSYLSAKAKALGKGKVQFTVTGHPGVKGYANIYLAGTRIAHVKTSSTGTAVFTVKASVGRQTFDLYFQAPGCTLEVRHLTGTVK